MPRVRSSFQNQQQRQRCLLTGTDDSIFPLPLMPFEAMALHDDWPRYPMTCGAVFRFRGRIHRELYDHAVRLTNQRHPLTQALVVTKKSPLGRQRVWKPSHQPFRPQWIGSEHAHDFSRCYPFDLQKENGVRMWVQQRDEECSVFVEFHHACSDGHGGLSYMEDVFSTYAQSLETGQPDDSHLPPPALQRLKHRGGIFSRWNKARWNLENLRREFQGQLQDLKGLSRFIFRDIKPLEPPSLSTTASSHTIQRLVSKEFDRATYQSLREQASRSGVRLNDLLLSRLFATLATWNLSRGARKSDWLRIIVPVDLRSRDDLQTPMSNCLSYHLVDEKIYNRGSQESRLFAITERLRQSREAQLPDRLLEKFLLLQCLDGWNLFFSQRRCMATAVLSNLGDPTRRFRTRFPRVNGLIRVGNLLMTGFEGTTALRPLTRASVFFNTYGNRLTFNARIDPQFFTPAQAKELLDLYADHLLVNKRISASRAA